MEWKATVDMFNVYINNVQTNQQIESKSKSDYYNVN